MKVNKKLFLEPRKKETFRRYLENKKHSWVLQEATEVAAAKKGREKLETVGEREVSPSSRKKHIKPY